MDRLIPKLLLTRFAARRKMRLSSCQSIHPGHCFVGERKYACSQAWPHRFKPGLYPVAPLAPKPEIQWNSVL